MEIEIDEQKQLKTLLSERAVTAEEELKELRVNLGKKIPGLPPSSNMKDLLEQFQRQFQEVGELKDLIKEFEIL